MMKTTRQRLWGRRKKQDGPSKLDERMVLGIIMTTVSLGANAQGGMAKVSEGEQFKVTQSVAAVEITRKAGTAGGTTTLAVDAPDPLALGVFLSDKNEPIAMNPFVTEINNTGSGGLSVLEVDASAVTASEVRITNGRVGILETKGDNSVTVSTEASIGVINRTDKQDILNITNHGTISINAASSVVNGGTINGYKDVKEVKNLDEGLIVVDGDGGKGAMVEDLYNKGTIFSHRFGATLSGDGSNARNDGLIEGHGVYALSVMAKSADITNTGKIVLTEERPDREIPTSTIVIAPLGEHSTTSINNNGAILSNGTAITQLGGEGDIVNIINSGVITGNIRTANINDEKGKATITVKNTSTGKWEASFDEEPFGRGELINYFTSIENDGLIITGEGKTTGPGHLTTSSFKNNKIIDISLRGLVITGDYVGGPGAQIITAGALGGDDTRLPKLEIEGQVRGEPTQVTVNNIGGTGAATKEGIAVIRAKTVDGEGFTKHGRIVAGAYDYDLVRMEGGEYTEWRLTSEVTPVPPGPTPPVPPGPTPPVPPKPVHKMRPEAGAFAENLRQANTLFMTDSEQRRAVGKYTDPVTGRTETSSLWLSQTGGHSARHDASGQLKSDYNRYTVQLGGTLLSLPAGDDGRLEAGVQAGYGHARGNTRSGLTGYRARGTVSGYSTGLYGTWRQHRDGQSGAYVSTTLQYSWLKNQVKGDDLAAEKYDARGTTLSLEGGYDYAVWQGGEQNGDSLFIRPHAQVTRMGVKADEHREANGTRVRQEGDGSVFSRTGVRVWLDKAVSKEQRVQPFVETNWLHNTRDFCSSMDGVRDCLAGNRNQAEVLAGVRGDVSPDVAVTAQAGGRFGSQAGRDLAGTLNVSVKF
ncbi:autotransporter outer membrane beta-barrel domain-containing protein [Salmonella enterica subsp. enterica serovar Java]|uniref:Autotransporter outer membrane beta-barrel domain-containing protein n=2 Tax=Salmonella enterica TaxID=28901 RepID=A0A743U6U6_SALER|nr:autotransporter outer membrane beta-barrel domain-containing protein [Salmonella enterica subsp. enterica serovar Java]EBR9314234.1 autotransporter outer membrane beta-barrel domain-containing protein [Salmonella enterica subsp. enterica serovar Muenchen]EDQ3993443.1 autotransporter outer membrane beta-barrel domain-containing protein [Salmonella enterica subsp. enterica]EDS8889790.1 autotransporter outer membrane beta-barrel domain-containing protein [Salmonella enterica]EDX3512338.1 autotr